LVDRVGLLKGKLIVSCQASPELPLGNPVMLAAMARTAEIGGAAGIRADNPGNIRAICAAVSVPVLGICKQHYEGFEPYITPTVEEVLAAIDAGARLIAVDGTPRPRPGGCTLADIVAASHERGVPVMADCSTLEDGLFAEQAGADLIGTTLSGYTPYSPKLPGPDFALISALAARCSRPIVAEGRIHRPEQAREAVERGAFAVVVGTAITAPQAITQWFAEALASAG